MERKLPSERWSNRADTDGYIHRYFDGYSKSSAKEASQIAYSPEKHLLIISFNERTKEEMSDYEKVQLSYRLKTILQPSRRIVTMENVPVRCVKGGGNQVHFEYYCVLKEQPTEEQFEALKEVRKVFFHNI